MLVYYRVIFPSKAFSYEVWSKLPLITLKGSAPLVSGTCNKNTVFCDIAEYLELPGTLSSPKCDRSWSSLPTSLTESVTAVTQRESWDAGQVQCTCNIPRAVRFWRISVAGVESVKVSTTNLKILLMTFCWRQRTRSEIWLNHTEASSGSNSEAQNLDVQRANNAQMRLLFPLLLQADLGCLSPGLKMQLHVGIRWKCSLNLEFTSRTRKTSASKSIGLWRIKPYNSIQGWVNSRHLKICWS